MGELINLQLHLRKAGTYDAVILAANAKTSLPKDLRPWTPHEARRPIGATDIIDNHSVGCSQSGPPIGAVCCNLHGELSLEACDALRCLAELILRRDRVTDHVNVWPSRFQKAPFPLGYCSLAAFFGPLLLEHR